MEASGFLSQLGESTTRLFRHLNPADHEAPRLRAIRKYSCGPFLFQCWAQAGLDYAIQATTRFESWETVQTGRSTGEWFDVVDSAAPGFPCRFYRIGVGGDCSQTIIGFVSVSLPPGHAMIANPLAGSSDTVSTLLPQMPEGTQISRFDSLRYQLTENKVASGRWLRPEERLDPGEGAIFFNPTSESMTRCFAGNVILGRRSVSIAAGFSIRSSILPLPGRLDTDLGFPVATGDAVHVFDRATQSYAIHEYGPEGWRTAPPVPNAGESFWVAKQSAATWTQQLVLSES
jgi:hypothetical protein